MDASFYEGHDLEALAEIPNYYQWILENFRDHLKGKVVEVGAGLGHAAALYADAVEQLLLLEPAENLYQSLANRFASNPRVTTRCGLLEDLYAEEFGNPGTGGAPYDAALLMNVLEHVEDDAGMLRTVFKMLRPGGALLLFVPALPFLYGSFDSQVGHLRRYTRAGLTQQVRETGFEPRIVKYFDLLGVLPWLIVGRVFRRGHNERAAQIYGRFAVPIGRALELRIPPPIGKNLILIARRN